MLEVWMVLLDSVIQYGHHHTLSCDTLFPGFLHIEVTVVAIVLKRGRQKHIICPKRETEKGEQCHRIFLATYCTSY